MRISRRTWFGGAIFTAILAFAPITVLSGGESSDLVQFNLACASHGNCC